MYPITSDVVLGGREEKGTSDVVLGGSVSVKHNPMGRPLQQYWVCNRPLSGVTFNIGVEILTFDWVAFLMFTIDTNIDGLLWGSSMSLDSKGGKGKEKEKEKEKGRGNRKRDTNYPIGTRVIL